MVSQTVSPMQEHLDRNVKEVVRDYPAVAGVLESHGIGCVTCGLGTCQLKDIIEIHALDAEAEAALMSGIAGIIYPGRDVALPRSPRKSQPAVGPAAYSPPMKELVDEHSVIKRWLAIIPAIAGSLDTGSEAGRAVISQGIDFIRSYADRFHHAKEEDILFKYFDQGADIIKTICSDHENARERVRLMRAALDSRDDDTVRAQLAAYGELLSEHIKKEDEVLYRWMDRRLTMKQVGELYSKFQEKDREFGDAPNRYVELLAGLEQRYSGREDKR